MVVSRRRLEELIALSEGNMGKEGLDDGNGAEIVFIWRFLGT